MSPKYILPPPPGGLPPREVLPPAGVPAFQGMRGAPPRSLLPEPDFQGRDRTTASRGSAQPAPLSSPPLSLTLRRRAGGSLSPPSSRSPNFCAPKHRKSRTCVWTHSAAAWLWSSCHFMRLAFIHQRNASPDVSWNEAVRIP